MDGKQDAADYADSLHPGYRFCPTDAELIVYYLKPKVEKKIHPRCRFYDVNIYDYHPKELAEKYTACEDKWYFLTPREPRYAKGKRPNRRTKDEGTWKASQRYTTVEGSDGQVVGLKRNFAYLEKHVNKTEWLMHEYTTTENKMSDCVLCKIYKKETAASETTTTNKRPIQQDQPSPAIRRRISSGPQQQAVHEINQLEVVNHHNAQMITAASPPLMASHHPFPEGVVSIEEVSTSQKQCVSPSINTSNSYPVDPFSMTSQCFQHQPPIQSMEVPQVDNQDGVFDELFALLDQDNDVDEIDMDEIAKLMATLDEDDAEDNNSKKQSMEVSEHDVANARFEDKDVSRISFSRSDSVEVFSLDDLFSS